MEKQSRQNTELKTEKQKIGDIAEKIHQRTDPSNEENYFLYSFSAYDNNEKMPVIESGKNIKSAKYKVPDNSVLISKLNPRINRVWRVKKSSDNAICSTEFIILKPKEGVSLNYLYAILNEPNFRNYLGNFTTGTSGSHQRVKQSDILEYEMRKFTIYEKKIIGQIYGLFDDKIEINNQINNNLEEVTQTLFKSWFVDFEPYEEFKDSGVGRIPDNFEIKDLTDVADVTYGYAFSSDMFNQNGDGEPIIRIRNLPDDETDQYSPEVFDDKYRVEAGDILVGMDGEFKPYIWKGPNAGLNQRVCKFEAKAGYSNIYIWNVVKKPLYKLEQSKTGTTVIHLGKGDIDEIEIAVPDEESLAEFNEVMQPAYQEMIIRKQQNRHLKNLRDTLLPKLMSGDVRINNINFEDIVVDREV